MKLLVGVSVQANADTSSGHCPYFTQMVSARAEDEHRSARANATAFRGQLTRRFRPGSPRHTTAPNRPPLLRCIDFRSHFAPDDGDKPGAGVRREPYRANLD